MKNLTSSMFTTNIKAKFRYWVANNEYYAKTRASWACKLSSFYSFYSVILKYR